MRRKNKGMFIGMTGACSYGTNPLFALPLYALGLSAASVLFYRYTCAIVLFFLWLKLIKKESLKITLKQALYLLPMGIVFSLSSLTLFMSYNYIDAGIASTILFIYPVMVAVIMAVFFHERLSKQTVASIIITTLGIALLYKGKPGETLNVTGILLVLASALSYAVYMVALKTVPTLKHIHYSRVTFYVMLFGLIVYLADLKLGLDLQPLQTPFAFLCVLGIAVFPTIFSLETMTVAIKLIGPTLSAILGALEPVTAIFIGVLLFHEQLTLRIVAGIILILAAVLLIVLQKKR